MPADIGGCGDGLGAIDEIEVDHRVPAVSVAFLTGLDAGLAADAARRVDVKLVAVHLISAPVWH